MLAFSLLTSLISLSPQAHAAIYKWQDKNGDLHFSDVPRAGAKKIILPEPQSYSAPKIKVTEPVKNKLTNSQIEYKNIEITYPTNSQTIKNNTGIIQVNIKIEPELAKNNLIQFSFDGMASGSPQTLHIHEITNVYRGTHTVSANIISENGKVISKASTITFYMQRPLVNQNNHLRKKKVTQHVVAAPTQVVK